MTIGARTYIRSVPGEFNMDKNRVMELAQQHGYISAGAHVAGCALSMTGMCSSGWSPLCARVSYCRWLNYTSCACAQQLLVIVKLRRHLRRALAASLSFSTCSAPSEKPLKTLLTCSPIGFCFCLFVCS